MTVLYPNPCNNNRFDMTTAVALEFKPQTNLPCQGLHRLEKYLNLEDFLEKSLKIKSDLKSTRKSLKGLEKSNSSIFCRT